MLDMHKEFHRLLVTDKNFLELVMGNYEVTSYLIMNTEFTDIQCNEMESIADVYFKGLE